MPATPEPSDAQSLLQQQYIRAWERASSHLLPRDHASVDLAVQEMREEITRLANDPDSNPDLVLPVLAYSYCSLEWLPDYATLDLEHIRSVQGVIDEINRYDDDKSLTRPLNFLLIAKPGSGKSQLIKSLAKKIGDQRAGYVNYNMATMQDKDDLGRAIDAARNVAIERKLPMVFLDEFDSSDSHYPLLLPLLWDGELDVGHRSLRLGRVVFFLAGSRPTLPERLNRARDVVASRSACGTDDTKLVDLVSRINGSVVTVPSLADADGDPTPDKVVIAMQLLRRRFRKCRSLPWSLLSFIAKAHFRYESRSIATLVNLIPVGKNESANDLEEITAERLQQLPLRDKGQLTKSPLAFHLIDDRGARGLVKLWKDAQEITLRQELLLVPPQFEAPNWSFAFQTIISKLDSPPPEPPKPKVPKPKVPKPKVPKPKVPKPKVPKPKRAKPKRAKPKRAKPRKR